MPKGKSKYIELDSDMEGMHGNSLFSCDGIGFDLRSSELSPDNITEDIRVSVGWERFESQLTKRKSSFRQIRGLTDERKIEEIIRKYGGIEEDLEVYEVLTIFKEKQLEGK